LSIKSIFVLDVVDESMLLKPWGLKV